MKITNTSLSARVAVFFLCLLSWPGWGQIQIKGTVKDMLDNQPMLAVSILEKGTQNGVLTDAKGQFNIKVASSNSVLVFSFIGYINEQEVVGSRTLIDVKLSPDVKAISEVVVVGYQSMDRKKTTGAIATVKGADIVNTPYATFDAMLQGRVAGLSVLSTSGEPGANNIVNIRGSSSVTLGGSSPPLYVIDNIVYDVSDISSSYGNSSPLSAINPNDIESIDILKDASASAIYGARAANGVIIVKTKRPKAGRPEIRVSSYVGIANRPALKPVIVGAAERQLKVDLLMRTGNYANLANGLSAMLTDSLNPAFNNNTDWQGLFMRTAVIRNVDASIAAADEKYSYRLSFNNYQEQGVMKGYDLKRFTPSLAVQFNPSKVIQVSNNLFVNIQKSTHGSGDGGRYPFSAWSFPSSFWQIREQEYDLYSGRLEDLRDDDRTTIVNGNTNLVLTPFDGLTFTSTLAYEYFNNTRDYFLPGLLGDGLNRATNTINQMKRWEFQNYASYIKQVKEHHNITALLGQGAEFATQNYSYLEGKGGTISAIKTVAGIAPGANLYGNSAVAERSRLSYFGRLGYDYKGRYLFQVNYRADGSSRYSSNRKWGSFPSVSTGWIASEEPFFSPLKGIVSFLKIRGSYGITGQDPGDYYAQYQRLVANASYTGVRLDNGSFYSGTALSSNVPTYNGSIAVYPNYYDPAAASDITWVRSPQTDIGLDATLGNGAVTLAADYYIRDSKQLVFNVPVGVTTGYTNIQNNYVDVRNTGIELTLNTRNLSPSSALQWSTNFNVAFNRNFVTRLPNGGRDVTFGPPWMQQTLTVGQPLFVYNGWQVDGVYATAEEVPVDPLTNKPLGHYSTSTPYMAGDPKRRDMNGDYIIDDLDKVQLGSPNPKWTGGFLNSFAYKGLTLDVLFTFIQGRQLWNGYLSDKLNGSAGDAYNTWGAVSGPATRFPNGATFWTKPGDQATYGGLLTNPGVDKWHIGQSTFVEDASFIRFKNVRLGYTIPEKFVRKLRCKTIRFYGILDNLHVWSKASVPDPELLDQAGYSSGNDYPLPKKYTFGLEVTF